LSSLLAFLFKPANLEIYPWLGALTLLYLVPVLWLDRIKWPPRKHNFIIRLYEATLFADSILLLVGLQQRGVLEKLEDNPVVVAAGILGLVASFRSFFRL